MSKFTPGPWHVGCPNGKRHYVMVGGHTIIAELPHAQGDSAYVVEQFHERESNARLIAAATDMYAELELALRYLDHPDVRALPFALPAEAAAERCRAALAKARGES